MLKLIPFHQRITVLVAKSNLKLMGNTVVIYAEATRLIFLLLLVLEKTGMWSDPNDPNNHCRRCNTPYATRAKYRYHLKKSHKMRIPPLKPIYTLHPELEPDIKDSNNHCRACERTMSNRGNYNRHLKTIHNIIVPPMRKKK